MLPTVVGITEPGPKLPLLKTLPSLSFDAKGGAVVLLVTLLFDTTVTSSVKLPSTGNVYVICEIYAGEIVYCVLWAGFASSVVLSSYRVNLRAE